MNRNLKIGWQTGLTYQAPQPMDKDYLFRLLERMAENGMNLLSVMLASPGTYDPNHDGICWPTENPRLRRLQDTTSPNSHWKTEFFREAMRHAGRLGIDINLVLQWKTVFPERIQEVYPEIVAAAGINKLDAGQTYCSRNPATQAYFLELLSDLIRLYGADGIHSVTVEGPFADWCGICASCRQYYKATTGTSAPDEHMRIVAANLNMREVFKRMAATIKDKRPSLEFWVHSGPWPERGHQPDTLLKGGVDCLMNYFCHDLYEPEAMASIMDFVNPLPCCPQTCVRDKATHNYSVRTKTPEEAKRYTRSILETVTNAANGIGAVFFNEVYLSEATRTAVYDECNKYVKDRRR